MGTKPSAKESLLRLFDRLSSRGSYAVISVTAVLILLAGLWTAKESGSDMDIQMRRDLVRQATAVAAAINPSNLRALSFTPDDEGKPEYQRLCTQLKAYAGLAGIESLYTMALQNGHLVFGPESPAEGSPLASPPGTIYENPTKKDFDIFSQGGPQIQGPQSDEYGTFVTASAPVVDPRTGDVLAVVGIDVDASAWQATVRMAQWMPAGITMVLLLILLLNWLTLKHRQYRSPQRHERKRRTETILCIIFMSLLTLVLAVRFDQVEREARRNTFQQLAQTHTAVCVQEFFDLRNRIDQLACLFESSQDVTREEFSLYCNHLIQQGILQGCVWLPAVPEAEAGAFVKTVRAEGLTDFSIWQKNKQGSNEPASSRPVYYPALYIEPLAGHEAGLGYDLNSEPARSAAIQDALRTGLATATDPVRFIALSNSPSGFFIFQPVNASVQKGLVAFAVRPENLLGGAQRYNKKWSGLEICLFQLRPGKEPLLVAGSDSQCGLQCLDDDEYGIRLTVPVFRFGKTYVLRVVPDSSWMAAHPLRHGLLTGLFGLLVTILISSVVALITNRRIVLEKRIARRTAELQASEKRFKDVALNTGDWFWETDAQGVYSYVSEKSFELLGYTPRELIGKTPFDLMLPGQAKAAQEFFAAAVKNHKPFRDYENWNLRKDGNSVCLLSRGVPVFADDGTLTGYRGTDTDITERKRNEAALDARMDELQRWQTATIGRESRIGELKSEVNALAVRLGQPPPYAVPEKSVQEDS